MSSASQLQLFLSLWNETYECRLLPKSMPIRMPPTEEGLASGLRRAPHGYRHTKLQLAEPDYVLARELLLSRGDFGEWRAAKARAGVPVPPVPAVSTLAGAAGGSPPALSDGRPGASRSGGGGGGGTRRSL